MDETAETMDVRPCPVCGRRNATDARFCGGCGQVLVEEGEAKADVADPLIGQVIADRYRIVALLGRGGMGVVYKVEHVHIGKLMAMKLLARRTRARPQHSQALPARGGCSFTTQSPQHGSGIRLWPQRWVDVPGDGVSRGQRPRAACTRGGASRLRSRRTSLCAQVCASVDRSTRLGNRASRSQAREHHGAQGFGRARDLPRCSTLDLAKLRDHTGGITVTRAGAIVGTPYYMSPEQIRGEEVDSRGDVYAIGAMIYKAATGRSTLRCQHADGCVDKAPHRTPGSCLRDVVDFILPPIRRRALSAKAMEKDPADRYQERGRTAAGACLDYLNEVGRNHQPVVHEEFGEAGRCRQAAFATRERTSTRTSAR